MPYVVKRATETGLIELLFEASELLCFTELVDFDNSPDGRLAFFWAGFRRAVVRMEEARDKATATNCNKGREQFLAENSRFSSFRTCALLKCMVGLHLRTGVSAAT